MKIGQINKLEVIRKTDIGYMLTDNKDEVFLHNNETNFQNLKSGDLVEAFLYYDFKNRLAATLNTPFIEENESAFLKVVSVNYSLGAFLDIGINKDLLLSFDDLPQDKTIWPKEGDYLYAKLVVKNRLVAKLIRVSEITKKDPKQLKLEEILFGYVIEINESGLNVLTKDMQVVFVHHTQKRKKYRLGEEVEVKIIRVYENTVNGSFILQKEKMIDVDKEVILDYLKKHKKLKLTNFSSPEEIKVIFPMSKKAFKRAIGSLYKEDLIMFTDNYIIYKGDFNG